MPFLVAACALAAGAFSIDPLPFVPPARSVRQLGPVLARRDRKKRERARAHMRNQGRRGDKLGRRLRRKFELGMAGAF